MLYYISVSIMSFRIYSIVISGVCFRSLRWSTVNHFDLKSPAVNPLRCDSRHRAAPVIAAPGPKQIEPNRAHAASPTTSLPVRPNHRVASRDDKKPNAASNCRKSRTCNSKAMFEGRMEKEGTNICSSFAMSCILGPIKDRCTEDDRMKMAK